MDLSREREGEENQVDTPETPNLYSSDRHSPAPLDHNFRAFDTMQEELGDHRDLNTFLQDTLENFYQGMSDEQEYDRLNSVGTLCEIEDEHGRISYQLIENNEVSLTMNSDGLLSSDQPSVVDCMTGGILNEYHSEDVPALNGESNAESDMLVPDEACPFLTGSEKLIECCLDPGSADYLKKSVALASPDTSNRLDADSQSTSTEGNTPFQQQKISDEDPRKDVVKQPRYTQSLLQPPCLRIPLPYSHVTGPDDSDTDDDDDDDDDDMSLDDDTSQDSFLHSLPLMTVPGFHQYGAAHSILRPQAPLKIPPYGSQTDSNTVCPQQFMPASRFSRPCSTAPHATDQYTVLPVSGAGEHTNYLLINNSERNEQVVRDEKEMVPSPPAGTTHVIQLPTFTSQQQKGNFPVRIRSSMRHTNKVNLNSSGSEEEPSPLSAHALRASNYGISVPTAEQIQASFLRVGHGPLDDICVGRQEHNAKERMRRARIKISCDQLRHLVPGMSRKTDKATVFEFAVHYLGYLKSIIGQQYDYDFMHHLSSCGLNVDQDD